MKKNSGLADSPFFPQNGTPAPVVVHPPIATLEVNTVEAENRVSNVSQRDTMIPSHRDTVIPRYHDTVIDFIRKEVKKFGKEPATHRFTLEEKQLIRQVIRDFEDRGIRTAENEITRIGIHFLIDDYKKRGEESVLASVLKELH